MNPGFVAGCIAVIPCLNEAIIIGQVVRGVREFIPAVLVIDDGSTDATAAEARSAGAQVVAHLSVQGKGAALADGLAAARAQGFRWALVMDGDGQHSPMDIPKFLAAADRTTGLVVGNRMPVAEAMPPVRRWVNRWMSRRLSRLAGRDLPDTQCGFRMIPLEAWSRLPFRTRNFEIESEMLLGFVRAGYPVVFVPIEVIYKFEQSKIHPVRDTLRWFCWFRAVRRGRGSVGPVP